MSGARCWSSSSTGGLASIWKQWWTMFQQLKWRLRVTSRSTCCAKNEPAPCNVHLGGKLGIFASAVMSSALCQNLLVTCEVSGGGKTVCIHGSVYCLVVIMAVQRCHLPRDFLHVQFIGMALNRDGTCRAPGISAGFEVVGSSESDTEVHDSPQLSAASSLSSPTFDTPEFATPSPESCPLVDTPVFRRRALSPLLPMSCQKFRPHHRSRCSRQMFCSRRAQLLRLVKVDRVLLQQPFRMKTTSLQREEGVLASDVVGSV